MHGGGLPVGVMDALGKIAGQPAFGFAGKFLSQKLDGDGAWKCRRDRAPAPGRPWQHSQGGAGGCIFAFGFEVDIGRGLALARGSTARRRCRANRVQSSCANSHNSIVPIWNIVTVMQQIPGQIPLPFVNPVGNYRSN